MISVSKYRYGAPTFPLFVWLTLSSHSGLYSEHVRPPLDVLFVVRLRHGRDGQVVRSICLSTSTGGAQALLGHRVNGTVKDRLKSIRGFHSLLPALHVPYLAYHNLFRPHSGIGEKTPAEELGVKRTAIGWLYPAGSALRSGGRWLRPAAGKACHAHHLNSHHQKQKQPRAVIRP